MKEFNEEFLEIYTKEDLEIIDNYIDTCYDGEYDNDVWECECSREKIHTLQDVFHFTFTKNRDYDNQVCMSLAQGVDYNEVVDYNFEGVSEQYATQTQEILSDVVLDRRKVQDFLRSKKPNWNLINMIFEEKKSKILELYSKQNYDDYVTGGGTTLTDSHYRNEFKKLNDRGLFWTCVYKTVEVDRDI